MNCREVNKELMSFLDDSPTPFHAVENMKNLLLEQGYTELFEGEKWNLKPGTGYFTTRNGSALIAFRIPKKNYSGFQIMSSHCDSPVFRVKNNAEVNVENMYVKLNVERYGGMIVAPWFDRPLSIAGRVVVKTDHGVEVKLIHVKRDLAMIPNVAIHMRRNVNDGLVMNIQTDLLPLFGDGDAKDTFQKLIAKEAGVKPEQILDSDLYLFNRMKSTIYGVNKEYIASGRLDDLQCAFASLKGFIEAKPKDSVAVHCVYDNEEVGSGSKQGAAGTFLSDVLHRINRAMGKDEEDYLRSLASSFMISADNAHAVHPNHPELHDPTNRPEMNKGIVIKYSSNQKYTTDAVSGALFRRICEIAGVPVQTFANRSDMIGGSTLGNISQTQVALNTVDIGLPQLAMHSPYETAGTKDTAYLVEAARVHFSSSLEVNGDAYTLKYE